MSEEILPILERLARHFHGQGFVRSLVVEFADEAIQASLLLKAVHAGWSRGFLFHGQVHALVAAILLRSAWASALDGDAQA